ncbi:OmpA family protein [Schleiferia thermophila]|uniref:OmpA family protein n=1 Tax=Schleiferia thermophila TaxID=884107 RepID=UPI003EF0545F
MRHLYTFNPNYFNGPSWQISLNRVLNNTFSLQLGSSQVTFSANDRFIKPNGVLQTESPNFDRGLNVKTEIHDFFAGLVFRTDNGMLLPYRSIIAPYLGISALLIRFQSFADLTDDEGNFYNLASPQTRQNGVYETSLQELRTEGVEYSNLVPGARLDLGIRIRLSSQISLLLSTQWTLALTDYLDDVSGTYPTTFADARAQRASDPTDRRFTTSQRGDNQPYDFYLFHSLGFQWSFGSRKKLNRFPVSGGFAAPPSSQNKASIFDPLLRTPENTLATADTTSLAELQQQKQSIQNLEHRLEMLSLGFQILNARQQISNNQIQLSEIQKQTELLSDSLKYYNDLLREVNLDTILSKTVRDSLAQFILLRKNMTEKSLDSLVAHRHLLVSESDSLNSWLAVNDLPIAALMSDQQLTFLSENTKLQETTRTAKTTPLPDSVSAPNHHQKTILADSSPPTGARQSPDETQQQPRGNQHINSTSVQLVQEQTSRERGDLNHNAATIPQDETLPETASPGTTSRKTSTPLLQESQTSTRRREIPASIRNTPSTTSARERSPVVKIQSTQTTPEPKPESRESRPISEIDTVFYTRIATILDQQSEVLKLLVSELKELQNSRQIQEIPNSDAFYDTVVPRIDSSLFGQKIPTPYLADFRSKTTFYFDKGKLLPDSNDIQLLRRIGKFLADSTESFILLTGYADNTGSIPANINIINSRLQNIRNILIEEGVNPVRIRMEVGGIIVRGRQKDNFRDRRVDISFFWQ